MTTLFFFSILVAGAYAQSGCVSACQNDCPATGCMFYSAEIGCSCTCFEGKEGCFHSNCTHPKSAYVGDQHVNVGDFPTWYAVAQDGLQAVFDAEDINVQVFRIDDNGHKLHREPCPLLVELERDFVALTKDHVIRATYKKPCYHLHCRKSVTLRKM